jgi:ribonuclease-3
MDFSTLIQHLSLKNFANEEILREALTHRSFSKEHNERLEFLGDAVLELVITELLFADYKDKTEGELTSFRSAIVKTESLAEEALRLGLGEYIFMSRGEDATGGRNRQYILADTFESLIGAIFLDQGYEEAKKFIVKNLYYKIDAIVESRLDIDAKSKLQELVQEQYKETPHYKVVREEGPDHDKIFTVVAVIGEKEFAEGSGRSKQLAEQDSAKKTLEMITQASKA